VRGSLFGITYKAAESQTMKVSATSQSNILVTREMQVVKHRTTPPKVSTQDIQQDIQEPLATTVQKSKESIAGFGENIKSLSHLERGSLQPVFAVLKETLAELSGDPDDDSFTYPNKQAQMKEFVFALEVHKRQFNAYNNLPRNTNTDTQAYTDLCKNLATICTELADGIKVVAEIDGDSEQSISKDKSTSMSTVEFKTFQMSLLADVNDLPKHDQVAPAKFVQFTKNAWNTTCKAEARLRTGLNFESGHGINSTSIESLELTQEDLSEQITILEKHIADNKTTLDGLSAWTKHHADCERMSAHMKQVQAQLDDRIKTIKEYQSPDTKEKICTAKQLEIRAAIHVLEAQNPQTSTIKTLIATLEKRAEIIEDFVKSEQAKETDSASLLGKKLISGIGKLFHFRQANEQESSLKLMTNHLLNGNNTEFKNVATTNFTERTLMQSVLKNAGIKDASKQLKASISRELNSSAWTLIESTFTIPVKDQTNQSQAGVKVETTTKPAGLLFTDPNHIKFTSTHSPINASTAAQYTHTDATGNKANGGFNSHCSTEVQHVTTAATTSCDVNGEEVFGATRHGTLAPYGLDEAGIKAIPDEELGKTIHALFGKAEVEHTTITAGGADQTNADTNVRTSIKSKDPLREEFINELSNILLATENGQLDPKAIRDRIQKSMTDPVLRTELAGLVKANPVLGQLLQRQGALNRAREVFILEMTRNPEFLKQIAKGEEVLFTSVGLLTPDNLRHQLHKLFGFSASGDEKEMVAIQAQAWDDLRNEIAADRIVINGKAVKAEIIDFNIGVNKGATVLATNPIIGEAVSGSEYANSRVNNKSRIKLQTATTNRLARMQTVLNEKIALHTSNPSIKLDNEITALSRDIATIKELSAQIEAMWADGSYREAGNEPYKLASRVALLSHLLGGGTAFNN
jgi:Enterobacterial virulence protein IpgD